MFGGKETLSLRLEYTLHTKVLLLKKTLNMSKSFFFLFCLESLLFVS